MSRRWLVNSEKVRLQPCCHSREVIPALGITVQGTPQNPIFLFAHLTQKNDQACCISRWPIKHALLNLSLTLKLTCSGVMSSERRQCHSLVPIAQLGWVGFQARVCSWTGETLAGIQTGSWVPSHCFPFGFPSWPLHYLLRKLSRLSSFCLSVFPMPYE